MPARMPMGVLLPKASGNRKSYRDLPGKPEQATLTDDPSYKRKQEPVCSFLFKTKQNE